MKNNANDKSKTVYSFAQSVKLFTLLLALFIFPSVSLAESVCAVVKIEIKQELTLERQAFDAVMKINNGLDTLPIENVDVNVTFADEAGNSILASSDPNNIDAKFFIRIDSMTGIDNVSGSGVIQPLQAAEVHWLIIPAPGSANDIPSGTLYYVGASLSYTLGGEQQTTVVTPDFIYVKPLPLLSLDYFLTQDVIADNPFTTAIEPSEPFTLGVRVQNNGGATATNVKIDSAQPEIIENEQGLLINFLITGSAVNDQPSTPSLLINLGDVKPNESSMGRWDMQTTLEGQFTDFTATFSHADDLGGQLTSIIDAVDTHFLVHNVLVDAPGRDTIRDFLALDGDILRVYESDSVDTVVTDQSALASFPLLSSNTVETIHALNAPVTAGLMYVKLADPYKGFKVIKDVIRSDGKRLPLDNVWFSKKKDRVTKVWSYFINLFDNNSTGKYTIILENSSVQPKPPVLQAIPDRMVVEGQQIGFIVEASDPNGDTPAIMATGLPAGSGFTDLNSGTANFSWFTQLGQAGSYVITYTAMDNTGLTTSRSATIKVNPIYDTDGDGLLDSWEIEHFGDLSHDGTADADGDGYTDLQEFENATDPNVVPPAIPADLSGEPANQGVTLSWTAITDPTSYNLYWSDVPGVTKLTGTLIENATTPYEHTGLTNDEAYYYVISSVGPGGESDISSEISVIAGIRDWEAPQIIEQLSGGNAENPHVAARADGKAVAVWQQTVSGVTSIWASNFVPSAGWSVATKVSSNTIGTAGNVRVAMDSSGNAIAVWQQRTDAQADILASRFDSASSSWSTASLIENDDLTDAVEPQISMQADGRAVVLWSQDDSAVWSNLYIPASGWSTAERIESDTALSVTNIQVGLDIFGNALALWSSTADGSNYDIRSNRYIAGTGWDAPQMVRPAIRVDTVMPSITVSMGMSDIGNALAVWAEFDGAVTNIWASQFDKTTGWGGATTIENDNVGSAYLPRVSVDSTGNAVAIWQQSDGVRSNILTNQYTPTDGWATATLIENNNSSDASQPVIALTPKGQIVANWIQSDGIQDNLWVNIFTPGKGWQSPEIIETENAGSVANAQLGRDNRGDVFAVWQQFDGINNNVWFNRFALGNTGVPNILPVVVSNGEQTIDENTTVSLDVSSSFDQDGTIATYAWIQTAGTPVNLASIDTATTSFVAPSLVAQETLSFKVDVTDDAAGLSTRTINITVKPVNALPIADAGVDQSVNEQSLVTLAGAGTDTDGSIVSYQWSQLSGSPVTLSAADTAKASFTSPIVMVGPEAPEILSFRLSITDNEGGIATDDIVITVNPTNAAPSANAGIDQTVNEQTSVSLTGSGTDTDGSIASYQWTQLSGEPVALTNSNTAASAFTSPAVLVGPTAPSILTFRLTVTDNEGEVASSDTVVTVNPVNATPSANAGNDQTVDEQTPVSLAGTGTDTDGNIASYQWTQIGGPAVTLASANTTTAGFTSPVVLVGPNAPAVLSFRLTVTDNEGGIASSDTVVTVNPVNATPSANAGVDQSVNEQSPVNLPGSGADSDGSIASYQWTQLSGNPVTLSNANTATANFTSPVVLVGPDAPAILSFRLTVTDNEGGVASSVMVVTVNPVNAPPAASAGIDQGINEQSPVTLAGTGTDSDGSIASYQWSQLSGPVVTLSNANTATADFTSPVVLVGPDAPAILSFRLTVTDNEGGTATDDMVITVNPVNALPAANAGIDQSVNEQSPVSLTGAGTDSDGSIATYQWVQLSGPAVTLSNANTATASFISPVVLVGPDSPTVLSFRLTVTDNETGTATDDLVITVNPVNAAPAADAGLSRMVEEQTSVILSGSATDTDGNISHYSWAQLNGPAVTLSAANTATPQFTTPVVLVADNPTVLNFQLTVTDNEGAIATSDVAIGVLAVNANPLSHAGADLVTDEQIHTVLTGAGSDTDGTITGYQWTQASGTPVTLSGANSESVSFTTPVVLVGQNAPEVLTFNLTVTDNEGGVASDDVIVTVNPVNEHPIANANIDQFVDEQTTVNLSGSGADTDGSISAYSWVQLTGTPVTLNTPFSASTSFVAPTLKSVETLTFRLTVIDNETYTASDEVHVVVNPVNTAPIAQIGSDQLVNENTPVTLDGSASSDPDADGVIVAYAWGQIAGPAVVLNNANSSIASFTAPPVYQDTVFSFRFAVVDDEGGDAVATTNVVVHSTNPDDDADGMLDLWEIQYFGDLSRDGTQDFDGDGATDLQEHEFATDPAVAQSPGQPEIVSPDVVEVTTLQPALVLTNPTRHSGFPVTYRFEVYRDAAMSQQVATTTVDSLDWTVDVPLEDNTHYYWRARANGLVLFSEWVSSTFFVNTANDAPTQPQISYPQEGVWVNSFTPELSVNNSTDIDEDALTYKFEVYADSSMSVLVAASGDIPPGDTGSTSWTVDTLLQENNLYVWRAIVTDEHGLETASPASRIFINTVNDPPSVPTLIEPVDDSEISSLEVVIAVGNSIEPESEQVQYYFELDKVNTFDSVDKRLSGALTEGNLQTSWYVSGLDDNTWYYWRAKASDGRAESTWLQGRFFVNTVNDAPGVPTIDNPGDNAWVGTVEPTLSVFPAIDIDGDVLSYEFEVYTADSRGELGALLVQGSSATTYWQVTPALFEDGWYYWRARAVDEHGLPGEWALPVIFFADTDGVNDPPYIKLKKLKYEHGGFDNLYEIEHGKDDEHKKHDKHEKDDDEDDDKHARHSQVEIRWKDRDPDSNAFISIYYDTDNDGEDGISIVEGLREDPDGKDDRYYWDVSALAQGIYFVYVVIDDGNTKVVRYSPNAIIIGDGGGRPYLEFDEVEVKDEHKHKRKRKALIKWKDLDVDSNASISFYYDTDRIGYDGSLIVAYLEEDPDGKGDKYQWDLKIMPDGKYYIYAIVDDGFNVFRIYNEDAIEIHSGDNRHDD